MSHLSEFIPPRKNDKETKRRKNDISKPPNEPSDQIYTQEKDKKTKKLHLKQDLQMSHLIKFIPPRKKEKKSKRRKNDVSRPTN